jgi:glycosyltransferase involved in cell wall biosynthesis
MEDAIKKEHINRNKFVVIYNGMNSDEFYRDDEMKISLKAYYNFKPDDFIIGNVGVISVRKGQIYLLKAFKILSNIYSKLKLVIVGSIRNFEMDIYDEIINYIKDNELEDKVKILDTVRDVNKIYNLIDIFVMCSITEGFGLSAYEAMLTEKICIFSDIPVFKELTDNGKAGYLFENKNPESLSKVLKDVLDNYDNLGERRKFAREHVIKNFDYFDMVEKYDKLYS